MSINSSTTKRITVDRDGDRWSVSIDVVFDDDGRVRDRVVLLKDATKAEATRVAEAKAKEPTEPGTPKLKIVWPNQ